MKNLIKTGIISCLLLLFACSKKLPESYGTYLRTNGELVPVEMQNLSFKGNLFHIICGIKMPQGIPVADVEEIIIYLQNTEVASWQLSKLKFQESASIPSPFGNSYTELNLWVKDFDIKMAVSPIDKKTDMYLIKPATVLDKGYYALHQGELNITEAYSAADKKIFVFRIGGEESGIDHPGQNKSSVSVRNESTDSIVIVGDGELSEEEMKEASVEEVVEPVEEVVEEIEVIGEQRFFQEAEILLEKANKLFNTQNFTELRNIFIKNDFTFNNDAEWKKLEKGFRTWQQEAGKIKYSKVIERKHIWVDEEYTLFRMLTTYEKAGQITEEMEVVHLRGTFFIRFLGTR